MTTVAVATMALFMSQVEWLAAIVQLLLVGLAAWLILRAYQQREAVHWTPPPRGPDGQPVAPA